MGEVSSTTVEEGDLGRFLDQANRALKKRGIPCGVPNIDLHDEFVLAEGNSPMIARAREFIAEMQTADDEETSSNPLGDAAVSVAMQEPELVVRNSWYTTKGYGANEKHLYINIVEVNPGAPESERRVRLHVEDLASQSHHRLTFALRTVMKGGEAFLAAEKKAHKKLKELVSNAQYERYLLTGSVGVFGKSGVFYMIRKHRPTLAARLDGECCEHQWLCALCFHPLGYFEGTWVGALPPTDEVVAHLLHIRSDEHFFWKKANHIPLHKSNSGV